MLKNFLGIKLNSLSEKILSFWEKDFKNSFDKHIKYLNKNLENQEIYNEKFSKILQNMEIFDSENEDEKEEAQEDNESDDKNSNNDDTNNSDTSEQKSEEDSMGEGVDGIDDINEYRLDEQLIDTDSENQSSENIGARRLHTIMELLLEDLSFNASELKGQTISITPDYVNERLVKIVEDRDLTKFILWFLLTN